MQYLLEKPDVGYLKFAHVTIWLVAGKNKIEIERLHKPPYRLWLYGR